MSRNEIRETFLPENWADDWDPELPAEPPQLSGYQRQRTRAWKSGSGKPRVQETSKRIVNPAEMTADVVKASKEVIVNELIWQDSPFSKTHPVQRTYSQNPNFFTFALLCERVYADLEAENFRLQREMILTAFQHVND